MTFLTILLVLFIDRVLWDAAPHRNHHWFSSYLDSINSNGRFDQSAWGLGIILLPVLLLLGWLENSLFDGTGSLLEMALAGAVLLFSLGPRDLGRDTDSYLDARSAGQRDRTMAIAEQFDADASSQDPDQAVVNGLLVGACRRLIGPLFWFTLFGAVGAAAYRLAHLLRDQIQQRDASAPLAQAANNLVFVIDWAPMRLTAIGFAVAGNFDAVASAWKQCSNIGGDAECPTDESLLVETGYAALDQTGERTPVVIIEDTLALVWRSLTLWVVFAGAVTLFASL